MNEGEQAHLFEGECPTQFSYILAAVRVLLQTNSFQRLQIQQQATGLQDIEKTITFSKASFILSKKDRRFRS